jgi:hypothetical protein
MVSGRQGRKLVKSARFWRIRTPELARGSTRQLMKPLRTGSMSVNGIFHQLATAAVQSDFIQGRIHYVAIVAAESGFTVGFSAGPFSCTARNRGGASHTNLP